ncbi:MAG: hypothetical protein QM589_11050 [Thermomicrobiales bacterium]
MPAIWLRARHARDFALAFGVTALIGAFLSDRRVPLPFSLASGISLDAPVRAFAPIITVALAGFLLIFQQYAGERASTRFVASLDATLLLGYSGILLLPAILWSLTGGGPSVLAMARNYVFAMWIVLIGSHIIGTRLSVAAVTLGIIMTPPLLPMRFRDNPPPFVVTMAREGSTGAWVLVVVIVVIGTTLITRRGLPPPP